jgi:hypothetical protein
VDGGSVALNGTLTNGWLALSGDGLRIEGPSCGGTWRVTLGRTDEVVAASVNP